MNVVVTNLLTKVKDPSRRTFMRSHPDMFAALSASLIAHGHHLIVFHDCLRTIDDEHTSYIRVNKDGNPYFARWRNIARWLRHPDNTVDHVWCVDATDVVMLNDPFPHMRAGEIYSGSEPRPVGGNTEQHEWLYKHHPHHHQWCLEHPDLPFMNPGILGGSKVDVLAAVEALGVEIGWETTDMGAWQRIAHELFEGRMVTGFPVHTEYRALDLTNPVAWWAHK